MAPSSSGDLEKLREAIRHSQNELEPFRQQYRERLVQYAGDGYGENRDAVESPFNVYNLALRIYKRRLFSGQMRVLVTSRSPSERRAAWELGLAGDDVIREIKLDATFDKVLHQATTDHTNNTNSCNPCHSWFRLTVSGVRLGRWMSDEGARGWGRFFRCRGNGHRKHKGERLGNSTDGKAGARMVGIGCARGCRDFEHKGTELTEGMILPATRRTGRRS